MFLRTAFLLAFSLGPCTVGVQAVLAGELTLRIKPSWSQIRAVEPVVCQVVLRNESGDALAVRRDFGARFSTLRFEALPPGAHEYVRAPAAMQGISAAAPAAFVTLAQGEEYVAWDVLLPSNRHRYFDRPGKWQLRAVLIENPGLNVASDPVDITVSPGDDDAVQATLPKHQLVFQAITPGPIPSSVQLPKLMQLRDSLSDGQFKDMVGALICIAEIRDARTNMELDAAVAAANRIYDQTNEVARLWFADTCTKQLVGINQWELAAENLKRLPKHSYGYFILKQRIDERSESR